MKIDRMETQLLRAPEIFPSNEVLKAVLGEVYPVLEAFGTRVTQSDFALTLDWRYYNDGKSWLGKVCHKKKTVLWLSVWEGCFKTTFFFLERHLEGIAALEISEQIKEDFLRTKSVGKLLPMLFNINKQEQLTDLLKVIEFKKKAK
jgi:hypothetical protein